MDPNANLKEQAELLAELTRLTCVGMVPIGERGHKLLAKRRALRANLAELRAALAGWLNAGGFAPDWSRYPAAARYYGVRSKPLYRQAVILR